MCDFSSVFTSLLSLKNSVMFDPCLPSAHTNHVALNYDVKFLHIAPLSAMFFLFSLFSGLSDLFIQFSCDQLWQRAEK